MPQCWKCRWWNGNKNRSRVMWPEDRYLREQCRRHSPIANFTVGTMSTEYSEWPITAAIDGCGDYDAR